MSLHNPELATEPKVPTIGVVPLDELGGVGSRDDFPINHWTVDAL